MRITAFLRISSNGNVELLKREGMSLSPRQVGFELSLEVPDEAFAPPTLPKIQVSVPLDALIRPLNVSVEPGGEQ